MYISEVMEGAKRWLELRIGQAIYTDNLARIKGRLHETPCPSRHAPNGMKRTRAVALAFYYVCQSSSGGG